jgi:hypothetical protein
MHSRADAHLGSHVAQRPVWNGWSTVQPVRVTVNHMIRPTGVRAAAKYEHIMEAELGVATMLTTGGRDAGAGGYRARGTSVAAAYAEC